MRKRSRAWLEAYCGAPTTLYQRIAAILAPAILLGTVAAVLIAWRHLPQQIPTHYDFAGNVNGYGGRGTLLVMPLIGLVADLTVALVERFPESWNTGVRITVFNRVRVYRLTRDLLADLRLCMALIFVLLPWQMLLHPGSMPGWITGVMIALPLIPLLRYFIRLRKAR